MSSPLVAVGGSALGLPVNQVTIGNGTVTLASGADLLLQGSGAQISNPQGTTNGEAFGLGATVGGSFASKPVAVGNAATAVDWGVAVGGDAKALENEAVAVGNGAQGDDSSVAIGGAARTENSSIAIGYGADTKTNGADSSIAIGRNAIATAFNQLVIGGSGFGITQAIIGNGVTNAAPSGFVLQGTSGSGANTAGASVTIAGGQSTGSANGGSINLQISAPAGVPSTLNTLTTVASLSGADGSALFKNAVDSATGFRIQNSVGSETLFTADTTTRQFGVNGNRIKIGNSSGSDTDVTILQLDAVATAGVPATGLNLLNGGLFYNSSTNKVTIIENGAVKELCNKVDLSCGAGATTSLQDVYDDSTDPEITLTSSPGGITIRDNSTPIGGNLFEIQNNARSTTFLGVSTGGVSVGGVLTMAGGQTKDITTASAGSATALVLQPGDSTASNGTGANTTIKGGDASSTTCGTACIGGTLTLQAGSATGASGTTRNGGDLILNAGTGATANGTLTVGNLTSTNTVSIGSGVPAGSATQTINIGNASQANASSVIAVNILSGAAGSNGTATLKLANNDRVTQVDIGNVVADAARTLNVFSGDAATVDTINIGTGNGTVAGAKTIHIGDGTPTGSGTNLITVGSVAALANSTTIQGGNGSTAIQLLAAASGTITVGTTTAGTANNVNINNATNAGTVSVGSGMTTGTITIGGASQTGTITLGQATTSQIINIGAAQTATGNTLTVNMASSATGTGKALVTIGNTNDSSSLTLQAGTGNVSLLTTGNVTIGTADGTGTLLVLDTKNTFTSGPQVGDPTGVAGGMYYNSATGSFRCYEIDHWRDCLQSARTSYHVTNDMVSFVASGDIDPDPGSAGMYDTVTSVTGHTGIVLMSTNTGGAGTWLWVAPRSSGNSVTLFGNGDYWRQETVMSIPSAFGLSNSDGTNRYTFRSGFIDDMSTQSGNGNDGCFFRYTHNINSGKWQGVCRNNNTESTCDTASTSGTTVATDTWYRLTVSVNAAGNSADFQVNGSTTNGTGRCQISTNIPTAAGRETNWGLGIYKDNGTGDKRAHLDYMDVEAQFGTAR